jgi:hypothetical protein
MFFATPYSKKGYIGIERMTSAHKQGDAAADRLLFFCHGFPRIPHASVFARIAWADGQWHHVALAWKGQEIAMYLDGQRSGGCVLRDRIEGEPSDWFEISSTSEATLIDEVAIYSRALTAAEIEKVLRSCRGFLDPRTLLRIQFPRSTGIRSPSDR